jgi:predicted ester cyclase
MSSANRAAAEGIYAVFNGGDATLLGTYMAEGCIDHEGLPGLDTNGPEGFKRTVAVMRFGFPDLNLQVLRFVEDGDTLVAHFRMTGTHKGLILGIPPTVKSIRIEGTDMMRFEGGKAVEHWMFWDKATLMQQLGLLPPARPVMMPPNLKPLAK